MNANNYNNQNNSNCGDNDHLRTVQECTTALERVKVSTGEYFAIQTCHQTALCHTSRLSNEENLLHNLSVDEEVQSYTVNAIVEGELPTFQIRLISPCSHSPSPISNECTPSLHFMSDVTDNIKNGSPSSFMCHDNTDFVTLQDINAQIRLPKEQDESVPSTTNNLETIYEGVFLHTPPRQLQKQRSILQHPQQFQRNRNNAFLEKVAADIVVESDKENISPDMKRDKGKCNNKLIQ